MKKQITDTDRIDDAVLALMFLTLHDHDAMLGTCRAWKSFDWEVLGRLHEQGWILNPSSKAKSVVLTAVGRVRCEKLFEDLFSPNLS